MMKWLPNTTAPSISAICPPDNPSVFPLKPYFVSRVNPLYREDYSSKDIANDFSASTSGDTGYSDSHSKTVEESDYQASSSERPLPPIPEATDVVPRPIWPAFGGRSQAGHVASVRNYKRKRYRSSKSYSAPQPHGVALPQILREISISINSAIDNAQSNESASEDALHNLRQKINQHLDSITSRHRSTPNKKNFLQFSTLNSLEDELCRLQLLQRLGKFSERSPSDLSQRSSSSSGFSSDLTPTPPSSRSSPNESPPPASRGQPLGDGSSPTTSSIGSVDAAMPFANVASIRYQLIPFKNSKVRNDFSYLPSPRVNDENEFQGAIRTSYVSSFPGRRCPDFTLDAHKSERLIKKIQDRKKHQYWCRVIASFAAFVFFLFITILFSLLISDGKKVFGSLKI